MRAGSSGATCALVRRRMSGLSAADDERADLRRRRGRCDRRRLAERARRPEQPGVEELEQAPQLAEVVLDRRAAERQAMARRAAAAPPSPTPVAAFLIACASSRIT